jgi:hypothetical protein
LNEEREQERVEQRSGEHCSKKGMHFKAREGIHFEKKLQHLLKAVQYGFLGSTRKIEGRTAEKGHRNRARFGTNFQAVVQQILVQKLRQLFGTIFWAQIHTVHTTAST